MYPIRLIYNLYIITYAKDKSNKFFLGTVPVKLIPKVSSSVDVVVEVRMRRKQMRNLP